MKIRQPNSADLYAASGMLYSRLITVLAIMCTDTFRKMNRADFPTLRISKRKLAPKDKVLAWIDRQTEN